MLSTVAVGWFCCKKPRLGPSQTSNRIRWEHTSMKTLFLTSRLVMAQSLMALLWAPLVTIWKPLAVAVCSSTAVNKMDGSQNQHHVFIWALCSCILSYTI